MKLMLLVNPKATRYSAQITDDVEKSLGTAHDVSVVETTHRGHAIDLAREAAATGYDAVVVLGGDGTVNEAANGLVGTETALAALPGGSTNVFVRTIGGKKRIDPALAQVRQALGEPPQRIDLGLVNGRYFLFHVGMGYDAAVVAKVEKKPHLKRTLGQGIFVYAALAIFARGYDRKHPHFSVRVGGETVLDDGYFGICLKTNPYTYLGPRGLNLAPESGLNLPLTMVTLRTLKVRPTLSAVGSALGKGKRLRKHKRVDYRPGLEAVTVVGHHPFPYQVDGDYLGEVEELTFSREPGSLLLVIPS